MTHQPIKKIMPLIFITLLFIIPTTTATIQPEQTTTTPIESTESLTPELITHIIQTTAANDSGRYFIFTAGIRATSFFLKVPRLLTQRGISFIAEINYRSPLALTFVIHRSSTDGISITDWGKGTHRVLVIGFGHAAFSRPHVGSFGRYIGITKIKPIVF